MKVEALSLGSKLAGIDMLYPYNKSKMILFHLFISIFHLSYCFAPDAPSNWCINDFWASEGQWSSRILSDALLRGSLQEECFLLLSSCAISTVHTGLVRVRGMERWILMVLKALHHAGRYTMPNYSQDINTKHVTARPSPAACIFKYIYVFSLPRCSQQDSEIEQEAQNTCVLKLLGQAAGLKERDKWLFRRGRSSAVLRLCGGVQINTADL